MFAATEWEILQVSIETARETKRRGRDSGIEFTKLGMHLAAKGDVDLVLETPTADVGHVRDWRPHAQRGASFCFPSVAACDESDYSGAEFVGRAEFEDCRLFAAFSDVQGLRRGVQDRQLIVSLRMQLDLGVRAGAFDVVCHGHARLELIAGRGEHGHARGDYKRSANQSAALGRPYRVVRDRDSHDFQRAVEIIGHVINDFTLRVVGVDDAGPKHDRFFRYSFERIQTLNVAAAAESRDRTQERKFRNNQIDDLRGVDPQRAFTKIKCQRIGCLVVCDLKNSFIDREDDDLAWSIRVISDAQRLTRFGGRCGVNVDLELTFLFVRRKGNDAVAERADENFL